MKEKQGGVAYDDKISGAIQVCYWFHTIHIFRTDKQKKIPSKDM